MHYYKRNIGDYSKKCGRLTMLQHGAYTLLMDACYDREKFPTLEEAIDWTWASTEAEIEAVKFVLSRFFKLSSDSQYVQDRILCELLEYHSKAETNKRIALEREAKRRGQSTNRAPDVHEPPPNHKPLTINQEPRTTKEKKSAVAPRPDDVSEQVWSDWVALRKRKGTTISETAIEGARQEADKLGWPLEKFLVEWCTRGSQGLKAEWVKPDQQGISKTGQVNQKVISGLTRGLIGGDNNVRLLGN